MKMPKFMPKFHYRWYPKEPARKTMWYDGWGMKTELFAHNKRRYTFWLPNSNSQATEIVIHCDVNSPTAHLVDALDSALRALTEPANTIWEDHHRTQKDAL